MSGATQPLRSADVVVLGGGPAGALTGGLLARAGHRVAILERDPFPRFHIGESMLPHSLEVLERLHLLERVRKAGFPTKTGAVFVSCDGSRSARFDFGESDPPSAHPHAFQVDRAAFDSLLLDWARDQGAAVETGCRVGEVSARDDAGLVEVVAGDRRLRARYLVDAAGLDSPLARRPAWEAAPIVKDRVSVFGHFRLRAPATEAVVGAHAGDIVIAEDGDLWCWFIPLRHGITSVGFVLPTSQLPAVDGDSADARFRALVAQTDVAARVLRGAEEADHVRGVRSYGRATGRLHRDGLVLVGDAAGFIDPVFSSGLCLALASAERLAAALGRCLEAPDVEPQALGEYEAFVRSGMRAIRPFVEHWYDGAFRRVIYSREAAPSVRRRITSLLAGELWQPDNPFVTDGDHWIGVLDRARRIAGHEGEPAAAEPWAG